MQLNANATLTQVELDEKVKKLKDLFPHCKVMATIDRGYKVKFLTTEQESRAFDFVYNNKEIVMPASSPTTPDFTHMIKGYVESIVSFHVEEVKDRVESSFSQLAEAEAALTTLQSSFEDKIAKAETTVDHKIAGVVGTLNTKVDSTLVEVERLQKAIQDTKEQIKHAHDKVKGVYDEITLTVTNVSNSLEDKILRVAGEIEGQVLNALKQQIALEIQAVRDEKDSVVTELNNAKSATIEALNKEKATLVTSLASEGDKLKRIVAYLQNTPRE